jgi:hypothetical protein
MFCQKENHIGTTVTNKKRLFLVCALSCKYTYAHASEEVSEITTKYTLDILCKIGGSHSSGYEENYLLRYDTI